MQALNFAFVIEVINNLTGDLYHEASLVPVNFSDADLTIHTLGIGHVEKGIIRAIDKKQVDRQALARFLETASRLLRADQRLAA